MRATNGPVHKALVEVAGVPLLEHNLIALLAAGIDDVVVVIARNEPALEIYLDGRGKSIALRFGARLETFVESQPLGNIGAVGTLNDGQRDMLVVYVDNLTSMAPIDLLTRHRVTSAALTVATHLWELRNPFGEVDIEQGYIRAYREKPVRRVRISSGAFVVTPQAASLAPVQRALDAAQFCAACLAAGMPVAAYEHEGLWIDVNDARALSEAERLLRPGSGGFAS